MAYGDDKSIVFSTYKAGRQNSIMVTGDKDVSIDLLSTLSPSKQRGDTQFFNKTETMLEQFREENEKLELQVQELQKELDVANEAKRLIKDKAAQEKTQTNQVTNQAQLERIEL